MCCARAHGIGRIDALGGSQSEVMAFLDHLDEHNAEQKAGEHLAEDDEECCFGGRQPAEAHAQIPAVVEAQCQQLQPAAPTLLLADTGSARFMFCAIMTGCVAAVRRTTCPALKTDSSSSTAQRVQSPHLRHVNGVRDALLTPAEPREEQDREEEIVLRTQQHPRAGAPCAFQHVRAPRLPCPRRRVIFSTNAVEMMQRRRPCERQDTN